MFLYSIYDRVSGMYSCPLLMDNDGVAKRHFPTICRTQPQFQMYPEDLEIYRLGSYDNGSGAIVPEDKPVFLMRYPKNE